MTETRSVRIGDAERDEAISALGEHYAAGRINKDEYEERAGRVWEARFDADIAPLFADLPRRRSAVETPAAAFPARPGFTGHRRRRLYFLAPVMMLAVAGLAVLVIGFAPWLLFMFFWVWLFGGFGFHHRARMGHRAELGQRPIRATGCR